MHLFEQGNSVCSFELMQPASTLSPCNVIVRPEVSSSSSNAASHIMRMSPEGSINVNTAALEVELSSVTVDDTNAAWCPIDSI